MKLSKALSLVSLATKAGKTASGEFSTENEVKKGTAYLVIVADDSSENTKKMFRNMCTFYHVPIAVFGTKEGLGAALGKELRASVAVNDEGFAKALKKRIDSAGNETEVK